MNGPPTRIACGITKIGRNSADQRSRATGGSTWKRTVSVIQASLCFLSCNDWARRPLAKLQHRRDDARVRHRVEREAELVAQALHPDVGDEDVGVDARHPLAAGHLDEPP